ncbi:hypothetical protein GCM10009780_60250 [Actinomadura alba]
MVAEDMVAEDVAEDVVVDFCGRMPTRICARCPLIVLRGNGTAVRRESPAEPPLYRCGCVTRREATPAVVRRASQE